MVTLIKSLLEEKRGIGSTIKVLTLISLALITITCNGPRLMLGSQTFEKQTDYSLFSGKHARQIKDATEYATLRIDGLDLASCQAARQLIKLHSLQMLDSESYRRLVAMQRRCLPTRLSQFRHTIHSSSNQYKTEWTAPRQNWLTVSQHPNSQESPSPVQPAPPRGKTSTGSIQQ